MIPWSAEKSISIHIHYGHTDWHTVLGRMNYKNCKFIINTVQ